MPKIYNKGNKFQKIIYKMMSLYNVESGITEFGETPNKNSYYHLLTEEEWKKNFINEDVMEEVLKRLEFKNGIGIDRKKLFNTVSSQPCCFNLFMPMKKNLSLASYVVSNLIGKDVYIENKGDIYLEYIPDDEERLENKGNSPALTSADVCIFYKTKENKKGVLLIEFKYTENKFSKCTKKDKKKCFCKEKYFYEKMISNPTEKDKKCGYNKYKNWLLTEKSNLININKVKNQNSCPFENSLNQLWRNIILAENIKNVRKLDQCEFHIIYPKGNYYIFKKNTKQDIIRDFKNVLTDEGENSVKIHYLEDVVTIIKEFMKNNDCRKVEKDWIAEFEKRYLGSVN